MRKIEIHDGGKVTEVSHDAWIHIWNQDGREFKVFLDRLGDLRISAKLGPLILKLADEERIIVR